VICLTPSPSIRRELSRPYGILFLDDDSLVEFLQRFKSIISVGDFVTSVLLAKGVNPILAIVDGSTKRGSFPIEFKFTTEVRNPRGTISLDAVELIARSLSSGNRTILMVRGEEDMLVLPVLVMAQIGEAIVYGQPGAGAVVLEVSEGMKWRARSLLNSMEVQEC
jgi:uncharacterized protein (UPF0218 family)